MHPAKGAGRDSDSQKNLLRKLINEMNENHAESENHRAQHIEIAEGTHNILNDILEQDAMHFEKDKKAKENAKGDDNEEKKERNAIFKKLGNLPSSIKDSLKRVKDAPSNLMSSLGKKVKGFGGMLGSLAKGAGVGILAIVATAGLMSSGLIDGEKVKKNVLSLLSIGDEMNVAKLATLIAFPTAMKQIATGLVFFSAGGGIAGMTQGVLDKFDQGNWADTTKKNVLTLLSIGESLDGAKLVTLALFKPAMMAIGVGLAAFGIGTGVAGVSQLIDFDAQKVKEQVGTLLSIGEHVGSVGDAAWLVGFAPAMTLLGAGLAAFGLGSGIAGVSQLVGFDAQKVKDQVLTLLSIPESVNEGTLGLLAESGGVALALAGLGAGLAVFGGGQVIKALGDFFSKDDFADNTKKQVETLLSIGSGENADVDVRAGKVKAAMTSLSTGLALFAGGNLVSSLANAATGILNFIRGGESPIEQMLSIADRQVEIDKAASGIARMVKALERMSNINIGAGNVDIEGMLQNFGHLPALLDGLANGGKVSFQDAGVGKFDKEIDFGKGILHPDLKVPEVSAKMTEVNQALGFAAPRNAAMAPAQAQANQNSGTGGVVAIDASSKATTTNNNSSAMVASPEPATDQLDKTAP